MPLYQTPKVVASVNAPYLRLLKLWLAQSSRHMDGDLQLGCMDDESHAACAGLDGVAAAALPHLHISRDSRHSLLVRQMTFLRGFLDAGHDILHTDIDAFWQGAPGTVFERYGDDFICSREFGIPRDLAGKWGFVLCAGFYLARSSPATRAFFARWQERLEYHTREQIALNQLIDSLDPVWEDADVGGAAARRCRVEVDGRTMSILALPYELVTRDTPFTAPEAVVAHPYFERQFFTSHVALLEFILAETGSVNGYTVPGAELAQINGLSPRDAAALCALRWRLGLSPANGPNWTHLGCLQLRRGDREGAAESFGQAMVHGVADGNTQVALAQGLAELGETARAREVLRQAASQDRLEALLSRQASLALISAGAVGEGLSLGLRSVRRFGLRESFRLLPLMIRNKLRGSL
jgi:hypothetical protein